jgi:radical SAM-linked protein
MHRPRLQIRFRKQGNLRFIGHRDLARTFERLFRRVELPLAMSGGFHPHAKITFPSALAVGIEAHDEIVEITLEHPVDAGTVCQQLNRQAPEGLVISQVIAVGQSAPKPQVDNVTYQMKVPAGRIDELAKAIERFLAADVWLVRREPSSTPIDIRAGVQRLGLDGDTLRFQLRVSQDFSVRPREVLASLKIDDLETQGYPICRTRVQLAGDGANFSANRAPARSSKSPS